MYIERRTVKQIQKHFIIMSLFIAAVVQVTDVQVTGCELATCNTFVQSDPSRWRYPGQMRMQDLDIQRSIRGLYGQPLHGRLANKCRPMRATHPESRQMKGRNTQALRKTCDGALQVYLSGGCSLGSRRRGQPSASMRAGDRRGGKKTSVTCKRDCSTVT